MADNSKAKKYFWLKLKEGFFKEKEIKKLRKIAGGDTYTIIYLKLMLLSLSDAGRLFYDEIEDSFAEELALEIDEEPENVKVTLIYLQQMGLLELINQNEAFLTRIPESIGSETEKAALMRKSRARKKLLLQNENSNNVTDLLPDVTKCYTEIEKEKEINIDIEKEKEKELPPQAESKKKAATKKYVADDDLNNSIIAFIEYRKKLKKPMTEKAIELLISKLNQLSPDIVTQIEIINQSILNGWQGIFPLKQETTTTPQAKGNFHNFNQRQYDYDELERNLLNRQAEQKAKEDP